MTAQQHPSAGGASPGGTPATGTPATGMPATGTPAAGAPAGGTPTAGAHRMGDLAGGTETGAASTQGQRDQRSLGEIVSDVAQDLSTLMKQELELAKTEMKEEAAKAGKGAGLLGGAGVAGHLVLIFLSLTLVFALDLALPAWAAALIVTVLWAVVAGVLAASGRSALRRAHPELPKTQETLKEDAAWARAQKS